MSEKTTVISLGSIKTMGIKAATAALEGLEKVLSSIAEGVQEAFTVRGYRDYLQTVSRFGKNLASQLLVLQMAFGRLKVAIAKAFAPILEVVVPYINQAIFALIRFADTVRQFLTGLIAGVRGNDALADSAKNAADSEKTLAKAATSAGKAARRSLMGLDQLERLNAPTGGGSGYSFAPYEGGVSGEVQGLVDKIMVLLAPLLTINLEPLKTALLGLWEALSALASVLGSALEWLWYEVLTPFAAWLLETLAPVFTEGMTAALEMVTAAVTPLIAGIQALWEALKPAVAFIGEVVVLVLQHFKQVFDELAYAFQEKSPQIISVFQRIGQAITAVWGVIQPVLNTMKQCFLEVYESIASTTDVYVGILIDTLFGLIEFLADIFSGDWEKAWEGIKSTFKSIVNGIVGLLNALINGIVNALNAVIRAANSLSFTVPDWVPGIGGRTFGFHMRSVTAPQIPYLAQGAVLPANKPFLAMVGDQKHGTNIEAPLSTIQAAVATVMEEQTAAILAGFETSVGVQKEILEAVLGITIGDEVIGSAVARYDRKMRIMRGGAL